MLTLLLAFDLHPDLVRLALEGLREQLEHQPFAYPWIFLNAKSLYQRAWLRASWHK
jgi:hypothetical protein